MEEDQAIPFSPTTGTLKKSDTHNFKVESLDLSGIHWGYLNCWQSHVRGKKIKNERWFTYWIDLCGGTMRLYKDKSLPPDSAKMPPNPSVIGPSKENEQKVAFFGLQNATVDVLPDGFLYVKKLKQADFAQIFRRHLFRLVFSKINSTFIFQAPSNSSMLRWVSKIQEAITMSEYEQVGGGTIDERLKFAKFALEQRRWKAEEPPKPPATGIDIDDEEDFKKPLTDSMTSPVDPRLISLKEKLREKVGLLSQLIQQEQEFLGGKTEQEIIGKEHSVTTLEDYYLVPGRKDTFLCKGTKMTLFGQMPDKRWRCWVEIDDLITSMNKLIAEADQKQEYAQNGAANDTLFERNKQYLSSLSKDDVMKRGYPLIGSVPSSLVEELQNYTPENKEKQADGIIEEDFVDITPPTSPTLQRETDSGTNDGPAEPYSSHGRRTPRKTLSQLSFDAFFYNGEDLKVPSDGGATPEQKRESFGNFRSLSLMNQDSKGTTKSKSTPKPKVTVTVTPTGSGHSPLLPSSSLPIRHDESPLSSANNSPVMPVKMREGGFIIKKRLRQKGISIIVGSSSSEGESESEEDGNSTKIADGEQKNGSTSSLKRFSTSDITPLNEAAETKSDKKEPSRRSYATLPTKGSKDKDLLEQFSRTASVAGQPDGSKLFPKLIGPDVKPPRNERRTLKLSKTPGKGYGFYLQTIAFTSKTGEKDVKTFVRYVEEEGPAYMAGLREGDVIVEIEGEDLDKKDHTQLVNAVKNSQKELKMVVKFTDAVKRAELALKLKKKKDKLRARLKELEELNAKEREIVLASSKDTSEIERADSATSSGIGLSDDSSENLSPLSDHVTIQTSKFEEQTSVVKDSISEVRYTDDGSTSINSARTHITTTSDLLSAYSTDGHVPLSQRKSKPVNRSRSFSGSEKKVDPESVKFRGRLNSKDDGFITAAPSQTKSRPAAKILANRSPLTDYNNRDGSLKKPYKYIPLPKDQIFYNPSLERTGLPVKTGPAEETVERGIDAQDGPLVPLKKPSSLPHPARDRLVARNSRSKSYKIAVTTSQDGARKVSERAIAYEKIQSRRPPETDL